MILESWLRLGNGSVLIWCYEVSGISGLAPGDLFSLYNVFRCGDIRAASSIYTYIYLSLPLSLSIYIYVCVYIYEHKYYIYIWFKEQSLYIYIQKERERERERESYQFIFICIYIYIYISMCASSNKWAAPARATRQPDVCVKYSCTIHRPR